MAPMPSFKASPELHDARLVHDLGCVRELVVAHVRVGLRMSALAGPARAALEVLGPALDRGIDEALTRSFFSAISLREVLNVVL